VENGVVFAWNGKMEVGVELVLPQMLLFSDADLEDFNRNFAYFLRLGVPEGERFRLIVEAREESQAYLEEIERERGSYTHPLGELFFEERKRLFERLGQEGVLRAWRYYGFLTVTPPRGCFTGLYSEREYQEAMSLAKAVKEELIIRLKSVGIQATPLNDQQLFSVMWRWFNPDKPVPSYVPPEQRAPYGTPDYAGLRAQLAKSLVENERDTYLRVGEYYISGMAMVVSPDITWPGFADVLLQLGGEFYLVMDWYHRETAKEVRRLSANLRTALAMSKADTAVDPGVFVRAENYQEALRRVQGEGRQILDVGAYLIYMARSRDDLVKKQQEARGLFSQLGGARAYNIGFFFNDWVNLSPGSGRVADYRVQLLEDNAADFMPTWAPWRGLEKPVAVYEGAGGVPVKIDPFSDLFPAKHGIVVGGSGSGKSFFVQSLLNQLALRGVEVVIVDRGFNYVNWVNLLGGSVVVVDPVEGTSINPFELPEGQLMPSEEKRDLIRALFRALVPPPMNEQESNIEEAIFMAAVEQTYKMQIQEDDQGRKRLEPFTLSTVVRKLRTMEQVNGKPMGELEKEIANRLAYALDTWTGNSVYGKFLDRPSNVSLENPIVYFETGKLGQDGPLTQVGLLLISDLIWRKVTKTRKPKIIVLDEAWALLKTRYGAAVVENLYRRSRTFGAAVYAVTQSLDDFVTGYAQGIIENTYYHYLLKAQNQEENFKRLFHIPQRAIERVYQKLQYVKGQYSDIMVVLRAGTGLTGGVLRYRSTPLEYWAFTTDINDKAKREEAIARFNGDVWKAIVALARGEV